MMERSCGRTGEPDRIIVKRRKRPHNSESSKRNLNKRKRMAGSLQETVKSSKINRGLQEKWAQLVRPNSVENRSFATAKSLMNLRELGYSKVFGVYRNGHPKKFSCRVW